MSLSCFCLWLLKIKVPHPNYPSTLISIQVPNLWIHFSPERYFRIMELLNILYEAMETCSQPTADSCQSKLAPWSPADLATDGRILVWKVFPKFFLNLLSSHLLLRYWYFLLKNLKWSFHRELAIRLLHGILVSWCFQDRIFICLSQRSLRVTNDI